MWSVGLVRLESRERGRMEIGDWREGQGRKESRERERMEMSVRYAICVTTVVL